MPDFINFKNLVWLYRKLRGIIFNISFLAIVRYLGLPHKILDFFHLNSTEFSQNFIIGLMGYVLYIFSDSLAKMAIYVRLKVVSFGLIRSIRILLIKAKPLPNNIEVLFILKNSYNIDVIADIEYNHKTLSVNERRLCMVLQKSIYDILVNWYKLRWDYSTVISHSLANNALRKRNEWKKQKMQ